MARTTLKDRERKARIREREFRQESRRLRLLDNITDTQVAELKQIKTAEVSGKTVATSTIADWQALREMGAVKESEGVLTLTSTGAKVVAYESK
jgi:hypothetical protein